MTSALAASSFAACSSTAPARAQLLVVLDTDAPLVGQLASRPEISSDAAVDTVRIDVLDAQNAVRELQTFVVPDRANWPLSFGVEANGDTEVRIRIRLFRGFFGAPATEHGTATAEAPLQVSIERFARIAQPASGVKVVHILLREDCMGTPSSFLTPNTTCIDADHLAGAPTDGIDDLPDGKVPPGQAGSWSPALETPCEAGSDPARICIPGGFSVLGDASLVGAVNAPDEDPIPLRPVIVRAFRLDKYEYTVGRFRALLQRGAFIADLPLQNDPFCTWLGLSDPSNDQLPLNCVSWATAALVCQLEGGALPSEAEWEHAARGRGQRRAYPWGDSSASCCTASLSRVGEFGALAECKGAGVEPVGSHPSASCGGLGDVSRDGVVDLGGSVREVAADKFARYDDACWARSGILRDPICDSAANDGHAGRGSDWSAGLGTPLGALREAFEGPTPNWGFRCKYSAVAP